MNLPHDKDPSYNLFQLFLFSKTDEEDETPEASNGPIGINEWSPEARKSSSKSK